MNKPHHRSRDITSFRAGYLTEISGINATTLCYRRGAGWAAGNMFLPPDVTNRCMTSATLDLGIDTLLEGLMDGHS
jgi:hypothetical protein